MLKRALSLGTSGILIFCGVFPVQQTKASAIDEIPPCSDDELIDATGLIYQYHGSVTASGGNVAFTAWTSSRNVMSYIGFTNISVQRSSNGTTWTEEKTVSDILKANSSSHSLSNYPITVDGGYYYRIVCDHYADNGSGTTQSVPHTTNSVWIS